jgi:hypothetical protein
MENGAWHMTPLLPLDTWRQEIGLNPWLFWGLGGGPIVDNSKCSGLLREYSWQGSDTAGRDDLRRAIERAEEKLFSYLGYRVAPQYVETEPLPWPRWDDTSQVRYRNMDATGRRVAMMAPEFHIQAMGIEQLDLIGTATVAGLDLVYSDEFTSGIHDTFTITMPTTVTDPTELAVYFSIGDRFDDTAVGDRWRIEPVQVSITAGVATIVGRRWLVVKPILYESPVLNALLPNVATNFVTSLDVYRRTTNGNGNTVTTAQATLVYESSDCGGWGAGWCIGSLNGSTDPGTVGEVIGRAGIRDRTFGFITPAVATYNTTTGLWSSMSACNCYAEPDRVKLRYLAGYPLERGRMAQRWQQVVTMLAAAEVKRRIVACRETNERLHDLQMDMALQATETERYQRSPEDLNNPFGTRLGHIQSWKMAKDHILRRGFIA